MVWVLHSSNKKIMINADCCDYIEVFENNVRFKTIDGSYQLLSYGSYEDAREAFQNLGDAIKRGDSLVIL